MDLIIYIVNRNNGGINVRFHRKNLQWHLSAHY